MTFINKNIREYKYSSFKNPYQVNAPWPTMRGDMKNSGRLADLKWKGKSDIASEVIHFHTGNAIFSTPIIDAKERIYLGSADHYFYAFDPHKGRELWKYDAGEIIDCAGCIDKDNTVYIATGCSKIHAFTPEGKEKWTYDNLVNRRKEQFTFSSNFWFEANIVLGPGDGAIYVANDDFFLYKMTTDGKIIWGYRTGFMVWSAPSFWKDGTVYSAGFDHILYALEMNSGKIKWKKDLHGALVGSPAISETGILYQTSFNGSIYALNCQNGAKIWEYKTGSHVYASAAISLDNTVYFGSTNGTFYALNGKTGKIKWTYYIGDPIRASASIGPDPEAKVPYLIYFGGGDGKVYALEPNGNPRWIYDTLLLASNTDYPNINASVALGHYGLCVACSTGDVVYIPYDTYQKEGAAGFEVSTEKQTEEVGTFWHYVTPGGSLQKTPLKDGVQDIDPTNIITLRLILHEKMGLVPVNLISKSIKIEAQPNFKHRIEIQSDLVTMNIISKRILETNTEYILNIKGKFVDPLSQTKSISSKLRFKTRNPPQMASILSSENKTFKIVHMAVPQPSIVPSLDQIGLASLTIPFSVVTSDYENKTFSAFAVQKFGEVGVPQKRISLYAFSGKVKDDYFQMDCRNCEFEITSFTIPLDIFRISGFLRKDGTVARGSNLLIEKDWHGNLFNLMRDLGKNSPVSISMLLSHLKSGGLKQFFKAGLTFFPALLRQLFRGTWQSWGILNQNNKLTGVGTYRLEPIKNEKESIKEKVHIVKFEKDPIKNQIIAEINIPNKFDEWEIPISILIVEKSKGLPIPINYTTALKKETIREGKKRIILSIPKSKKLKNKQFVAYLMADIYPIKQLIL